MRGMNDESDGQVFKFDGWNNVGAGSPYVPGYLGMLFPERRDLVGWWLGMNGGSLGATNSLEVSSDSTSGLDGTWTSVYPGSLPHTGTTKPGYRTSIQPLDVQGVTGIRWWNGSGGLSSDRIIIGFHLYGRITPGEDSDRLRYWHPTLDQEVSGAYFDWGNVPRATALTREFRIKNVHPTLTAVGVSCSFEALTESNPTMVSQHEFSTNGLVWAPSANIGDLAPGAVSNVAYFRRNTSAVAPLGLWSGRIVTSASSYTT